MKVYEEQETLKEYEPTKSTAPDVSVFLPVYNEEPNLLPLHAKLDDALKALGRTAEIVYVDDGSTDSTPQILAQYRAKHDWIQIVTRSNRGWRAVGPGVVDAFYAGYETINPDDYDYLCKLDLDLRMPPPFYQTARF